MFKDPVCGMNVGDDEDIKEEFDGKTFRFCSQRCRDEFNSSPEKYVSELAGQNWNSEGYELVDNNRNRDNRKRDNRDRFTATTRSYR